MNDLLPHNIYALGKQIPQLIEEPDLAYLGFLHWVQLGSPSANEMQKVSKFSAESVTKWRTEWSWNDRLAASPAAAQARLASRRIQTQVELFNSETKASGRIMALIERTLTKLFVADTLSDVPIGGVKDLAALLKTVYDYERLEANLSTENVAVVHKHELSQEQIDELSVEEMLLVKKLWPKMLSGESDE